MLNSNDRTSDRHLLFCLPRFRHRQPRHRLHQMLRALNHSIELIKFMAMSFDFYDFCVSHDVFLATHVASPVTDQFPAYS